MPGAVVALSVVAMIIVSGCVSEPQGARSDGSEQESVSRAADIAASQRHAESTRPSVEVPRPTDSETMDRDERPQDQHENIVRDSFREQIDTRINNAFNFLTSARDTIREQYGIRFEDLTFQTIIIISAILAVAVLCAVIISAVLI